MHRNQPLLAVKNTRTRTGFADFLVAFDVFFFLGCSLATLGYRKRQRLRSLTVRAAYIEREPRHVVL